MRICWVMVSAVLPRGCVVIGLPLRSLIELMGASAGTSTWKYCGYSVATLQTFLCGLLKGAAPVSASTVEIELPKPTSVLPSSMPRTLAMPAPGMDCTERPGTAFSHMSLSWPPSGTHTPPCGPVISRIVSASAPPPTTAPANAASRARANIHRVMGLMAFLRCRPARMRRPRLVGTSVAGAARFATGLSAQGKPHDRTAALPSRERLGGPSCGSRG